MRRLTAISGALLLAACQVKVEGAACRTPGAIDADCPSGQGCGNDGKCSLQAAGCISSGAYCVPGSADCTGGGRTCGGTDATCGTWVPVDCPASGRVCHVAGGGIRCDACAVPGTAADCPSGQACGNDALCSAAAKACQDGNTRCAVGATRCTTADPHEGETCTGADPACGTWASMGCLGQGLWCRAAGQAAACDCQDPGADLYVDPGRPVLAGVTPNGSNANAGCELASLTEALVLAAPGTTVHAIAAQSEDVLVAPGAPLEVGAGVALVVDAGLWRIAPTTVLPDAGEVVLLHDGAKLSGFTIDAMLASPTTAPAGAGVALACGTAAQATLEDVTLTTNQLKYGVKVSGQCGAKLRNVAIAGPRVAALDVESPSTAVETEVSGGSFTGGPRIGADVAVEPAQGVRVTGGKLELQSLAAAGLDVLAGTFGGTPLLLGSSAGAGVLATQSDDAVPITLSISGADISANGGAGVVISTPAAGSAVSISGSSLSGNGATTYYGSRTAGGVIVAAVSIPTFAFTGNAVRCNGGDQIGVYLTGALSIDPTTCGAGSNAIVTTGAGYGVYATPGVTSVPATHNYWSPDPPNVTAKVSVQPTCTDVLPVPCP